ncbi:organoarsenical effux MFS transporter ArsJ [Shewanella eurypsychrophilus]|uniref:Organoarsenical effux MFS transporter ArsJ n=1 Tax=Shewanella eurypsychrophilus TaxID=2593656 RepID=A0ABX6VCU8_9GAMM|nr:MULTISPECIES: organoarsenical effux MFS transporter ArsJ [Shewanella]QFU24620.1 organoarsenical effux MFS transporter ArsJ [Shewanella sp. YLB-09]QPG59817.1 organoarsenical effux MFS transporter ArsJ [Shewanella eurypsychrophilus]
MFTSIKSLPEQVKQYLIVTGNYWAFTLTDGALRMLVVLHFHQLGYTPLSIAMLFLFYEIFGVVTNLVGGYLGARLGLNKTMNIGLGLQVAALAMLLVLSSMLTIFWVMAAQGISGIAKDLNKMSAKSSIKMLVTSDKADDKDKGAQQLYGWIAKLTGSKNALKGAGFFLGGALLSVVGFQIAIAIMAIALTLVWVLSLLTLKRDLGKAKNKPKFSEIFSKSRSINILSAARMFLFAARDVWFVVALPLYLGSQLGWDHYSVGGFLALWVIAYGFVQTQAPRLTMGSDGSTPGGRQALFWVCALTAIPALIALALSFNLSPQLSLLTGLMIFGAVFAVNSSLHSFLIVHYASDDGVSLDVGFYYMANAMGRLIGTVLSGYVYQVAGLEACLWISSAMLGMTALISIYLPKD